MIRLSKEQVLLLHEQQIDESEEIPGVASGKRSYDDLLKLLLEHQK